MSDPKPEHVLVAAIAGAFGVHGHVRIKSFTAQPEAFAAYSPLRDKTRSQSWATKNLKPVKGGFSVFLDGVRSKEAADALRGTQLFADRSKLPDLPDDEFYHADLVGLSAFDPGGALLGRVKAVQNHGAGDLIEVAPGPGQASVLVPFTRAAVPTVDLAAGRMVMDPPDGLFD